MNFAEARSITKNLLEIVRPPRRVPVSASAREHLRVAMAGGTWGPWESSVTPYMVEPMDCLSSRDYEAVVFCGPARTGKTQALADGWIAHIVVNDPGDMLVILPTQVLATDYAKRRVNRLHQHSETVGSKLSARAHDDNLLNKIYRNGMMLTLGWPTSSQLAQRDIRYVGLSDYDSMPADVDGEGEPFGLAKKRTETFLSSGKTMVESSPKLPRINPRWAPATPHEAPPTDGGILSLYNRGDRRRWYWACLHCHERFEAPALPSFEETADIQMAAQSARVFCPHCGAAHYPRDKRALNAGGVWVMDPTQQGSRIASFWMLGCAAGFQTWQSLVANYLRAKREFEATGNEESLKTTLNTDQGVPYMPAALTNTRTIHDMMQRAELFDHAHVPEGGRFLIATVDVQGRRFVAQIMAVGVGCETWIIDRFDIAIADRETHAGDAAIVDPSAYPDDWRLLLDRVLHREYPLADGSGRMMPIRVMGVDSGGAEGVTERAYDFWRHCKRQGLASRVLLLKGDARASATSPRIHETWPERTRRGKQSAARGEIPVYLLNTLILKDAVDGDLKRGHIHYAEWLGESAIEEMTAEIRTAKGWEKIAQGARNETWDLLVYGRALALHLGVEKWGEHWEKAPDWARNWANNPVFEAKTPPKKAEKRAHSGAGFGREGWNL